jgi:hypothetical protein
MMLVSIGLPMVVQHRHLAAQDEALIFTQHVGVMTLGIAI